MSQTDPAVQADDYDAVTARGLRQVIDEVRQERDALRAQLEAAQARLREAHASLVQAEAGLRHLEAVRQALHTELNTIKGSLGWTVLQRIHALKAGVLRPGSAAERGLKRLVGRLMGRASRP